MTSEELKEWIKNNLEIYAVYVDQYSPENDMDVCLKIKGDKDPFSMATVYTPFVNDYER